MTQCDDTLASARYFGSAFEIDAWLSSNRPQSHVERLQFSLWRPHLTKKTCRDCEGSALSYPPHSDLQSRDGAPRRMQRWLNEHVVGSERWKPTQVAATLVPVVRTIDAQTVEAYSGKGGKYNGTAVA